MTLAKCGSDAQIASLGKIQDPKLRQGMMYTLALRQENPDWLYQQFVADALAVGGGSGDPERLVQIARGSAAMLDWLEGLGVSFGRPFEARSGLHPRSWAMPGRMGLSGKWPENQGEPPGTTTRARTPPASADCKSSN